jgi:hypothetical protein
MHADELEYQIDQLQDLYIAFVDRGDSLQAPEEPRKPYDFRKLIAALRAKANEPSVTKQEAAAFKAKADELGRVLILRCAA